LKDIKDVSVAAPDGSTIQGRLETLAHDAAKDIKACSNACDTYSKKKLVGSCAPLAYLPIRQFDL
jgi:hypothetical protein